MLRKDLLSVAAGAASALATGAVAGSGAAFAETQDRSDTDVFKVRGRIAGAILQLQNIKTDYGGHRGAAITALQNAQTALDTAIDVRGADQTISDNLIRDVANEVGTLIPRLAGDAGNYGGGRAQAIAALRTAQTELNAAASTK